MTGIRVDGKQFQTRSPRKYEYMYGRVCQSPKIQREVERWSRSRIMRVNRHIIPSMDKGEKEKRPVERGERPNGQRG